MAGVWTAVILLTIVQWTRAQAPAGYEGCYRDSFIRVLPHEEKWDFQLTNARCVSHCRNRGYAYAGTEFALQCFCGTEQNFQNLPAALSDSECTSDCSGNNAEKCGGSLKLSVYAVVALENEIRLVGGSDEKEGRVEVRAVNTKDWGTVCDDGFDTDDATAACRMLGHGDAEDVRDSTSFGQGSGTIKMANLGCGGHESSLFDCSYDGPGSHSCSHGDDVGIVCKEKPASSGLGIGAIIGIVVGVIIFLTIFFILICVLACQSKPPSRVTTTGVATGGNAVVSTGGNTVVHTNYMGANTVVHSNMMYPSNGIVVQQGGAYPMTIQQPVRYQQPMQPPGYPQPNQPMQPQQPPGYPQPNQPMHPQQQPPGYSQPNMQPQQQPSHIPPPPAYEEPAKPPDGQLYSQ